MKASLETIHECASKRLTPEQTQALLADIEAQAVAEAEAEKANREPVQKKQFVILLSDPTGRLTPEFFEASGFDSFVGWVLQIPEDDQPALVTEKLIRASYEFNISKRGRKYPVKTIGEACEAVPARFLREQDLAVKTRIPVQVVVTDNKLPEGGEW